MAGCRNCELAIHWDEDLELWMHDGVHVSHHYCFLEAPIGGPFPHAEPWLITPAAREAIEQFQDFLRSAGRPDGHTLARLEHRPDLIRYVLNLDENGYPL